MNESEVKQFVKEVMIEMRGHGPCEFCGTEERRISHRKEHEFIRGLMGIADKWDGVRWEVMREALKGLSFILVTATIIGLVVLAKQHLGMGPK